MANDVLNKVYFDCSEDEINEILSAIQKDGDEDSDIDEIGIGTIDFNKIIPMPKSLDITSGTETYRGIEVYLNAVNPKTKDMGKDKLTESEFRILTDALNNERRYGSYKTKLTGKELKEYSLYSPIESLLSIGEIATDNILKYGATTWYDWAVEHWNTKWNSYEPYKDFKGGLEFSTAWSAPHPVIEALSRKYPDVRITHEWADEDLGSNCGSKEYINGECVESYYPETDKESLELATRVWDGTPEDFGYILNEDKTAYKYKGDEDYE